MAGLERIIEHIERRVNSTDDLSLNQTETEMPDSLSALHLAVMRLLTQNNLHELNETTIHMPSDDALLEQLFGKMATDEAKSQQQSEQQALDAEKAHNQSEKENLSVVTAQRLAQKYEF